MVVHRLKKKEKKEKEGEMIRVKWLWEKVCGVAAPLDI